MIYQKAHKKLDLCWKRGRRLLLNDRLLLYNPSLSLSDVSASVCIKLQPCVVSVSDHRTEAEEGGSSVSSGVDRGNTNRSDEVKNRPNAAENQLDLDPRNPEEPFDDVEDVKRQQDAGEPKARHRHGVEERSACQVGVFRRDDAYEAD